MLKCWKTNKSILALTFWALVCLSACESTQPTMQPIEPQPEGKQIDFNKFVGKVIVAEKTPSTVVYEYQDVRVDEISLLASMYCQDHGNRNAYLEKINLYKNNRRRASFYCSSK